MTTGTPFYQLHRHTLTNGLRIWCIPRSHSKTAVVMAQIPVGVRTETAENNGISHFLEHMLFTGTEKWDENEVTDVVRRLGGESNAQTSREETVYYAHVAAQDLAFGFEWIDQLIFKPTIESDKVEKERQVIINEKGGEYDYLRRAWEWLEDKNWGWSVSRAARRRLFPDSTLLFPVIGTDKTIKAINHEELVDYHQTYYVPNNVTVLVIGDVEPTVVFELAEKQYSEYLSKDFPETHPSINIVPKTFDVRLHGPTPTQQGQYLLGVLLDSGSHPDRFSWYIIGEMLENAYLQEIRFKHGFSYDVQAYPVLYTDFGYFSIYVSAQVDDFEEIKPLISKHLDRIVAGDFSETELHEAKIALRGRALLNLQDNLEFAWWVSTDSLNYGNDEAIPDYFEELERLTTSDIQNVAQRYFAPEKRYQVEHYPAITPRTLKPIAKTSALSLAGMALFLSKRRRHKS